MAYNFIYFNKENIRKTADVKITLKQHGDYTLARITFSSANIEDITKTGYLRFAVPEGDKNKLFFLATDKAKGYKLHKQGKNSYTEIRQANITELMKRFEGKYDLEITDENFIYVDRRNAL